MRIGIGLAIMLLTLGSSVSCSQLPTTQDIQQFLGFKNTFAHNDVPVPPTIGGFVRQVGLSGTRQIRYHDRTTGQQREIDDPQVIGRTLDVLRYGAQANPERAPLPTGGTVQLEFVIRVPEHRVSALYDIDQARITLYNVPTPTWPDHMVGVYAMPPDTGAALLAALTMPPAP
jgi:hypothetical protein